MPVAALHVDTVIACASKGKKNKWGKVGAKKKSGGEKERKKKVRSKEFISIWIGPRQRQQTEAVTDAFPLGFIWLFYICISYFIIYLYFKYQFIFESFNRPYLSQASDDEEEEEEGPHTGQLWGIGIWLMSHSVRLCYISVFTVNNWWLLGPRLSTSVPCLSCKHIFYAFSHSDWELWNRQVIFSLLWEWHQ